MDHHSQDMVHEGSSPSDQINPVNLVTRIKHEAEEPSSTFKEQNEMFDFVNSFRKRRRGRGRYVPYISSNTFEQTRIPFNCSGNGIDGSKKVEVLYPSTSMNCKHFSCPNCKVQFQNRDSLAMHMMESVRLEGCQAQKMGKDKTSSGGPDPLPSISRAPFTAHFENGCRDKSLFSSGYHDMSRERVPPPQNPPPPPTCFMCKVCGEGFLNLDALAMHMFVHVQHQQDPSSIAGSKDPSSAPSPKTHSLLSASSLLPLPPDSVWTSQLNSSLYFKTFMAASTTTSSTSILDPRQKAPMNTPDDSFETSKKSRSIPRLAPSLKRDCKSAPVGIEATPTLGDEGAGLVLEHPPPPTSPGIKEAFDSEVHFLSKLHRCSHCRILFEDLTTFCLHMGLHNVNNPWQCNMCGKRCTDLHEFTVHSLHF